MNSTFPFSKVMRNCLCFSSTIVFFFCSLFSLFLNGGGVEASYAESVTTLSVGSSALGPRQCTPNSLNTYMICASFSNIPVSFTLQPLAWYAEGTSLGLTLYSCDLYDSGTTTTSYAVCAKGYDDSATQTGLYFYWASNLSESSYVNVTAIGTHPKVVVDTTNQVAYLSDKANTAKIYKIINIAGNSPYLAGSVELDVANGDAQPAFMVIVGTFLFAVLGVDPFGISAVNLTSFAWNMTLKGDPGEGGPSDDCLIFDDTHLYMPAVGAGTIIRFTHTPTLARSGSLSIGYSTGTYSLAFSPNKRTIYGTAKDDGRIYVVDPSTPKLEDRYYPVPVAVGRPIIIGSSIYAFSENSASIFSMNKGTRTVTLLPSVYSTIVSSNVPNSTQNATNAPRNRTRTLTVAADEVLPDLATFDLPAVLTSIDAVPDNIEDIQGSIFYPANLSASCANATGQVSNVSKSICVDQLHACHSNRRLDLGAGACPDEFRTCTDQYVRCLFELTQGELSPAKLSAEDPNDRCAWPSAFIGYASQVATSGATSDECEVFYKAFAVAYYNCVADYAAFCRGIATDIFRPVFLQSSKELAAVRLENTAPLPKGLPVVVINTPSCNVSSSRYCKRAHPNGNCACPNSAQSRRLELSMYAPSFLFSRTDDTCGRGVASFNFCYRDDGSTSDLENVTFTLPASPFASSSSSASRRYAQEESFAAVDNNNNNRLLGEPYTSAVECQPGKTIRVMTVLAPSLTSGKPVGREMKVCSPVNTNVFILSSVWKGGCVNPREKLNITCSCDGQTTVGINIVYINHTTQVPEAGLLVVCNYVVPPYRLPTGVVIAATTASVGASAVGGSSAANLQMASMVMLACKSSFDAADTNSDGSSGESTSHAVLIPYELGNNKKTAAMIFAVVVMVGAVVLHFVATLIVALVQCCRLGGSDYERIHRIRRHKPRGKDDVSESDDLEDEDQEQQKRKRKRKRNEESPESANCSPEETTMNALSPKEAQDENNETDNDDDEDGATSSVMVPATTKSADSTNGDIQQQHHDEDEEEESEDESTDDGEYEDVEVEVGEASSSNEDNLEGEDQQPQKPNEVTPVSTKNIDQQEDHHHHEEEPSSPTKMTKIVRRKIRPYWKIFKFRFYQASVTIGFPAMSLAIPVKALFQGVVYEGLYMLFRYSDSTAAVLLALLGLILAFLGLGFMVAVSVYLHYGQNQSSYLKYEHSYRGTLKSKFWRHVVAPDGFWLNQKNNFVALFGSVFGIFSGRSNHLWWTVTLHLWKAMLAAILAALPVSNPTTCNVVISLLLVLNVGFAILQLMFHPFRLFLDVFTQVVMTILLSILLVLLAVKAGELATTWVYSIITAFSVVTAILTGVNGVYETLVGKPFELEERERITKEGKNRKDEPEDEEEEEEEEEVEEEEPQSPASVDNNDEDENKKPRQQYNSSDDDDDDEATARILHQEAAADPTLQDLKARLPPETQALIDRLVSVCLDRKSLNRKLNKWKREFTKKCGYEPETDDLDANPAVKASFEEYKGLKKEEDTLRKNQLLAGEIPQRIISELAPKVDKISKKKKERKSSTVLVATVEENNTSEVKNNNSTPMDNSEQQPEPKIINLHNDDEDEDDLSASSVNNSSTLSESTKIRRKLIRHGNPLLYPGAKSSTKIFENSQHHTKIDDDNGNTTAISATHHLQLKNDDDAHDVVEINLDDNHQEIIDLKSFPKNQSHRTNNRDNQWNVQEELRHKNNNETENDKQEQQQQQQQQDPFNTFHSAFGRGGKSSRVVIDDDNDDEKNKNGITKQQQRSRQRRKSENNVSFHPDTATDSKTTTNGTMGAKRFRKVANAVRTTGRGGKELSDAEKPEVDSKKNTGFLASVMSWFNQN